MKMGGAKVLTLFDNNVLILLLFSGCSCYLLLASAAAGCPGDERQVVRREIAHITDTFITKISLSWEKR